jgi:hypothetical protein
MRIAGLECGRVAETVVEGFLLGLRTPLGLYTYVWFGLIYARGIRSGRPHSRALAWVHISGRRPIRQLESIHSSTCLSDRAHEREMFVV